MTAQVSRMSHWAICVRSMEASLGFYRDLLGFRVILDRMQDTTEGGLPYVYKNKHAQRRVVHLKCGEGEATPVLVVTELPGDPPDGEAIKLDQIGISHVAFTVPDVESLARDLVAKGGKTSGPIDAFHDATGRITTVYFVDPDGMLVQFDQPSAS